MVFECVSSEIELVWHFGFQLTLVYECRTNELLLSSMKQFHTVNILAALLKKSDLCC